MEMCAEGRVDNAAMVIGTEGRKVTIDACAAIKLQRLERLGTELFTTSGVLGEIKDPKARAMLDTLPIELKVQEPLPEDLAYTKQFAKATGDFGFLSRNDLDIISLTVRLHKLAGGTLRDKPEALATASEFRSQAFDWAPGKAAKAEDLCVGCEEAEGAPADTGAECEAANAIGAAVDGAMEEISAKFADVSTEEATAALLQSKAADADSNSAEAAPEEAWSCRTRRGKEVAAGVDSNAAMAAPEDQQAVHRPQQRGALPGWDEADSDSEAELSQDGSSAGEWVTVENYHRFGVDVQSVQADQPDVKVTCATADYSVQNVLLQMGITPLTFDGYAVRSVKLWGLICRACFFFTRQSEKVFCPKCGHDTLVRVPIVVGQDGKPTALNAGRKLRRKGTIFSMPKPSSGRCWKPILAEDELKIGGRDREFRRQEKLADKEQKAKDPFDLDNGARGWWQRSITNTGKQLNTSAPRMQAGYGRMKNPNANNYGGFKKRR